jgi:hypothetical protein
VPTGTFAGNHGWFCRDHDSKDGMVLLLACGACNDMALPA